MRRNAKEAKGFGCFIPPSSLPYFLGERELRDDLKSGEVKMGKRKWKRFLDGKADGITFGVLYTVMDALRNNERSNSQCIKKRARR